MQSSIIIYFKQIEFTRKMTNPRQIAQMRELLKREIAELDNQIYDLQTFYLQNTKQTGNLIKGFQNYMSSKTARNQMLNKKQKIENYQRIFSLSSLTSKASEAFDGNYMVTDVKNQSSNVVPNPRRNRNRANAAKRGKSHIIEDENDSNQVSGSQSHMYSVDQESKSRIPKGRSNKGRKSKGIRKMVNFN